MQQQLADAEAYVARHLPAQPAGVFSSTVPLLEVQNTVGGTQLCMQLPRSLQERLFSLQCKHFNGSSACISCGQPDNQQLRATALIFDPGSVQIVGAAGASELRLIIHVLCDVLRADGHRPHILFVSIDNRVATGNLGFPVALERMNGYVTGFVSTYEPDLFPGMICMQQRHTQHFVMTVFERGKVTALGITSLQSASEAFLSLAAMASAYRAPLSVIGQKRKSDARAARVLTEKDVCASDHKIVAAKRNMSKKISSEMRSWTAKNAARLGEPGVWEELEQRLKVIISEAQAANNKRRRAGDNE